MYCGINIIVKALLSLVLLVLPTISKDLYVDNTSDKSGDGDGTSDQPFKLLDNLLLSITQDSPINILFKTNIKPYTISKYFEFPTSTITINKNSQNTNNEVWIIFEKQGGLKMSKGSLLLKFLKIQKISDNTANHLLWADQYSTLNLESVDFSECSLTSKSELLYISSYSVLNSTGMNVLSISFSMNSSAILSDGTGNVSLYNTTFQKNEISESSLLDIKSGPASVYLKNASFFSNTIRKSDSYPSLLKFTANNLTFEDGNFQENRVDRGSLLYLGENNKKTIRLVSLNFFLNYGAENPNPVLIFSDFLQEAEFLINNTVLKNNIALNTLVYLPMITKALNIRNFKAEENLSFNVLLIENLSGALTAINVTCLKNNDIPKNLFNNIRLDNFSTCFIARNLTSNLILINSTFNNSLSNVGTTGLLLIYPNKAFLPISDSNQLISIENCTFANNVASANLEFLNSSTLQVHVFDLSVILRNCTFEANAVKNNVSLPTIGFFSLAGTLILENSKVQNNKGTKGTVALAFFGFKVSLNSSLFTNNSVYYPPTLDYLSNLMKIEANFAAFTNCVINGHDNFSTLITLTSRVVCEYILISGSAFIRNRINTFAIVYLEDNYKLKKLDLISTDFKSNELSNGYILLGNTYQSMLKSQKFQLTNLNILSNKARGLITFLSETQTDLTFGNAVIGSNIFEQSFSAISLTGLFKMELTYSNIYNNTLNKGFMISLRSSIFNCYQTTFKDTAGGSVLIAWNENTVNIKNVAFLNTLLGVLFQGNDFLASDIQFKDKQMKKDEPQNFFANKGYNTIAFKNFYCSGVVLLESAIFDIRNLESGVFDFEGMTIRNIDGQVFSLRKAIVRIKSYEISSSKLRPAIKMKESQLYLSTGSWLNVKCEQINIECGIKAETSVVTLEKTSFSDSLLTRSSLDSFISVRETTFSITDCQTEDFSTDNNGGVFIKADISEIIAKDLDFKNSFQAFGLLSFANVTIDTCTFSFSPLTNIVLLNSFLTCFQCNAFSVSNSYFENIASKTPRGAGIAIIQKVDSANYFEIINSTFHNITAQDDGVGGALFVNEAKINIQSSRFQFNSAKRGAATFFSCRWIQFDMCQFVLEHNQFINNTAKMNGGAIKWEFAEIFHKNSSFINNSARYGKDISGFPYKLAFEIKNQATGEVIYNSVNNSTLFTLENASPGYNLNEGITFFAVDSAGDQIKEEVFEDVILSLKTSINLTSAYQIHDSFAQYYKEMKKTLLNSSIKLLSSKRSTNVNSDYKFYYEKVEISAKLNTSAILFFTVKGLAASYSQTLKLGAFPLNPNEIVDPNNTSYSIIIPVFFRSCRPGEIYSADVARCIECQEGYYSLQGTDTICKQCPPNTACMGGNKIILSKGYWRSSIYSDNIYQCFGLLDSCEGGFDSKCSSNYVGPLCGDCLYDGNTYYQKSFSGECTACPNVAGVVFIYLIIWFVFALFIITVINLVVNPKFSNSSRILIKIFINYLHLIIILQGYNLSNVPNFFQRGLYGASRFTNFTSFYFSLECIVFAIFGSYKFFYQALVIFVIWLLILLTNSIYCIIRANLRANLWKNIRNRIIIIFFFLWPSSLGYLFSHCMCKEIDGISYSLVQPTEPCWTQEFSLWMIFFYYPLVLILAFTLPFKIWRKVNRIIDKKLQKTKNKNKNNIFSSTEDLDLRQAIYSSIKKNTEDSGFYIFLLGYSDPINGFRWERNSYLLKIIIIMINYSNAQDDSKVIVVFIFMFYLTYSLIWLRPFEHRVYNYFSIAAILVVDMIIYLLLWYSSDVTEQGSGFLLFLVLFMQLAFFFVWLRFLFKYLKTEVPEKKGNQNNSFVEGLDDSRQVLSQVNIPNNKDNSNKSKK